jgi:hypothetical protein
MYIYQQNYCHIIKTVGPFCVYGITCSNDQSETIHHNDEVLSSIADF